MPRIELGDVSAETKEAVQEAAALDERPVAWWSRRALLIAARARIATETRKEPTL